MRPRKIRLERLPDTETRLKLIAANNPVLPVVTWSSPPPVEDWLNSNATDPTMEPFVRSEGAEIQYTKRCNCGLLNGDWCNCA